MKTKNNNNRISKKELLDYYLSLNSVVIELKTAFNFLQNNIKNLENYLDEQTKRYEALENKIYDLDGKINAFIKIFYPLNTAAIFLLVVNLVILILKFLK